MSDSPTFGEKCRTAVQNLAQIHNRLAEPDLHPDTRRDLETKRQDAKIHFQCLLRSARTTSE